MYGKRCSHLVNRLGCRVGCTNFGRFIGITDRKAVRRMNTMNEICFEKVLEAAGKYQMLIFVHSRKETARTAKTLVEMAIENDAISKFLQGNSAAKEILTEEAQLVETQDLRELLPYGFAIHHAGLSRKDRSRVYVWVDVYHVCAVIHGNKHNHDRGIRAAHMDHLWERYL